LPPNDQITSDLAAPATPGAVEFPDNRLLIDLCGEYDKNLAQVEAGTDVEIIRRGNRLVIVGETDARAAAIEVVGRLYARLEDGKPL